MAKKIVTWTRVLNDVTINATGSQVTVPIDVTAGIAYSAKLIINSGSLTKVKLESQVIESDQGDAELVGVAAIGETAGSEQNKIWDVPDGVGGIVADHQSGRSTKAFILPATMWARLKVTGISDNGSNTKVSLWVCVVEEA